MPPCAITSLAGARAASRRRGHLCVLDARLRDRCPAIPGSYLRRAFYRLTLRALLATLTHRIRRALLPSRGLGRRRRLHRPVRRDRLRPPSRRARLIGTRANLLSGSMQHRVGRGRPVDASRIRRFRGIDRPHCLDRRGRHHDGRRGRGLLVAAGGRRCRAGTAGVVVAGNPARFVRRVQAGRARQTQPEGKKNQRDPICTHRSLTG